jgi:hypothetical protein
MKLNDFKKGKSKLQWSESTTTAELQNVQRLACLLATRAVGSASTFALEVNARLKQLKMCGKAEASEELLGLLKYFTSASTVRRNSKV